MHLMLALVLALQTTVDPLLSRFLGEWSGTGTVLSEPSKIEMSWSAELGGEFVRLTLRNEMPKSLFEGHAYYRALGDPSTPLRASGRYRGMWFDNSGMMRPIEATMDGDALVSKWGTPETEEGETTYRLLAGGRMEVVDRVKSKDGTWRQFGQSGLMKR
jgi:hypothetical protein